MSFQKYYLTVFISIFSWGGVYAGPLNLSGLPLYLGGSVKPNVMVMLDNSGSMKAKMYTDSFNSSRDYYGIFDSSKTYEYDPTILVNATAYGTISAQIDTSKTGAFKELISACDPTISQTCWSGKYLNWLTTRRADASRMALVGGKLESRTAFTYGSGYQYKIIGNNEHGDRVWTVSSNNSDDFSPIPNNSNVTVTSPAMINNGNRMALYDPYAKVIFNQAGSTVNTIFDNTDTKIGEFGNVDISAIKDPSNNAHLKSNSWTQVTFASPYTSAPVVIAKPPTIAGGDPALVRIKEVTLTGFKISLQEWPYKDGNHIVEMVSYMVLESGSHTLPGGKKIEAGTRSTQKEYAGKGVKSGSSCIAAVTKTDFDPVSLSSFSNAPVVIASTMTYNNLEAVNARIRSLTSSGFDLALQQQEAVATTSPVAALLPETIGYIAVEPGTVDDVTNNWKLLAGTQGSVTQGQKTIDLGSDFSEAPTFLAAMTTINGSDPAVLRLDTLSNTAAVIHVEEEKSCDNEVAHSSAETVGYIALQGLANTQYNFALVTTSEPIGLLQDISADVRLGVSFYRYPPDKDDIYNGVTTQGGTLRFKIPNNPFVKKPSHADGGGYRSLDGYITTPIADVVDAIEHYPLVWGTTPLAENLWEVIQYFEQDDPYYADVETGFKDFDKADNANPERDPYYYADQGEKLWCAKSNVIIFTDGEPYRDAGVPVEVQDYDEDTKTNDTVDADQNVHQDVGKDNLDDVAYWAFCDKSKGSCLNTETPPKATEGSRDLRTDLTGTNNVQDKGQFLNIHTVGFGSGSIRQILQDTANNAGGEAYAAEDGHQLKSALTQAFEAAQAESSAASVALNSGSISGGSKVFQARFDSNDWSGQLLALPIIIDASTGLPSLGSASWDAGASNIMPTHGSRKVITYEGGLGKYGEEFTWLNMSTAQKLLLDNDPTLLDFLRGDQTNELAGSGTDSFRDRGSLLGDIVHSAPKFVGPPSSRYPDNWGSGAPENTAPYSTFKSDKASRDELIYVGANDGMLHAFDADNGVEKFAYIPKTIFKNLKELASTTYAHQYYVDGQSTVVDVFFASDSAWHTVLVSGLGGGGQGLFAIDVTNPADFNSATSAATKVLWEFTDENASDLGYTFGQASIVRLRNGEWAAVFGNGYNNTDGDDHVSTSGNAVIYMLNIETGAVIDYFDTESGTAQDPTNGGRPNGMSTPAVIDTDGDFIADAIYAGDLFGNLWKVDLTGNGPNQWDFTYATGSPAKPQPLFKACAGASCSSTNSQPITTQPQVVNHPNLTGYLVYFGTGKYVEIGDNTSTGQTTQTFYSVWDKLESQVDFDLTGHVPKRSNMLQQSIILETSKFNFDVRATTANIIDWATHYGWYMDLYNTGGGNTNNYGERQVSNAVARNGRVIFTTLVPLDDICEPGGTGWLMELNLYSGARLDFSPFDLNGDLAFTSLEYVNVGDIDNDGVDDYAPVSGKKSKVGIIPTPSIVNGQGGDQEYKFTSGSSGAIEITTENPGPTYGGRQSWRQLDFHF